MKKRIFALLLVLVLALSLLPAPIAAEGAPANTLTAYYINKNGVNSGYPMTKLSLVNNKGYRFAFYYNGDPVPYDRLQINGQCIGKEADDENLNYVQIRTNAFGGAQIKYTPQGGSQVSMDVDVCVGFSSGTTTENAIREWAYDGTDKTDTIYLLAGSGFYFDYAEKANDNDNSALFNLTTVNDEAVNGQISGTGCTCLKLTLNDELLETYPNHRIGVDAHFMNSNNDNDGYLFEIDITNAKPHLAARYLSWDGGNQAFIERKDQEHALVDSLRSVKGYRDSLIFYYVTKDGETPIEVKDLTVPDGGPLSLEHENDGHTNNSRYARLRYTDFGESTVSYKVDDSATVSLPVSVSLPPVGFYTGNERSEENFTTEWKLREQSTLYIFPKNDFTFSELRSVPADGSLPKGITLKMSQDKSFATISVDPARIDALQNSDTRRIELHYEISDGNGGDQGSNIRLELNYDKSISWQDEPTAESSLPVLPSNLANKFLNGDELTKLAPKKFNFNGQNLYVSLAQYEKEKKEYIAFDRGMEITNPDEALTRSSLYCIVIFKEVNGSYLPIDDTLRDEVLKAYNFSLTVYRIEKAGYIQCNENDPIINTSSVDTSGWPCGMEVRLNNSIAGSWAFYSVMMPKAGGSNVEAMSVSQFGQSARRDAIIQSDCSDLEGINGEIETIVAGIRPNEFVNVILPEGDIYGEIVIPDVADTGSIELQGNPGNQEDGDGDTHTTLHGSIRTTGKNDNSFYMVNNLNMVGAGKDKKFFEDGKTPNYGIYGTAECDCNACILSGYYHARHAEDDVLAWNGESKYQNNHVAIYMESPACTGGNYNMYGAKFIGNDIAIQLEKFSKKVDMKNFGTRLTCFIDNGTDVVNNSGRILWIDYNFFYHSDHTAGTGNSVSHSDGNPNLSGIFYESNCVLISKASKASSHTTPHGKDIPAVVVNHFAVSPEIVHYNDGSDNGYDNFKGFYTASDYYSDIFDLAPLEVPASSLTDTGTLNGIDALNIIDSDGKWYYSFDFGEELN